MAVKTCIYNKMQYMVKGTIHQEDDYGLVLQQKERNKN